MNNSKLSGRTVYVVDGARTPFLKARGKPGVFSASDLAVKASQALLLRNSIGGNAIDEVIFGCVMPGPDEANIARIIALRIGCDESTPAWTVQRNCASGLQSLDCAALNIACGRADLILAGGVEAMSKAPVLLNDKMVHWLSDFNMARSVSGRLKQLFKLRPAMFPPVIALLRGLTDPVVGLNMGQTAEVLAHRFNISRELMDQYALRSHQRLASAQDSGHMQEIVPIYSTNDELFEFDDGLRRETDLEKLGRLKPIFDRTFGKVTAGNSSQVTDGAACLLLASERAVSRYNLRVMGKILDCEWSGLDPKQMGLGPAYAMAPLLQRHTLSISDIDYWEINEAFAAQVLACIEAWKDQSFCKNQLGMKTTMGEIDQDRLNIDGGGICIGHPVGASGSRIVLHLLHILKRKKARRGIASLCIGGGQGGAMLVETCE